jgi:hypothetical protein
MLVVRERAVAAPLKGVRMKNLFYTTAVVGIVGVAALGCASTSAEEQRRALTYQQSSDEAASKGHYEKAGDDQQNAHDAHHKAVDKAIDEGKTIPPQPQMGDKPPPPPPTP